MWWVEEVESFSEQVEPSETDKPLHRGGQKRYHLALIWHGFVTVCDRL